MKKLIYTTFLLVTANFCLAQKPAVDFTAIDNWSFVTRPAITNDGKYALYNTATSQYHASATDKMVIKQIGGNWKKELTGIASASFTADSHTLIGIMPGDSLCLLKLGGATAEYIPSAQGFSLFSFGKQDYLLVRKMFALKEILLKDLQTGKDQVFPGVVDFTVSPNGSKLILHIGGTKESGGQEQLAVYDLLTHKQTEIFKGFGFTNYVFTKDENKMAFAAMQVVNKHFVHIFYSYKFGEAAPVKILDDQLAGIDTSLSIERIGHFTRDGRRLFFTVKAKPVTPKPATGVMVDVWNYQDAKLQSVQLLATKPSMFSMPGGPELPAVLNLDNGKTLVLSGPDDNSMYFPEEYSDDYIFRYQQAGTIDEMRWSKASAWANFQINTKTGERTLLDIAPGFFRGLSPDGRFLIGSYSNGHDLFARELATGKTVNLTSTLPVPGIDETADGPLGKPSEWSQAGWFENDAAALLYDKYDIWQVDPSGKKPAINLTGGYGRAHHIVLRFLDSFHADLLKGNETLLLSAFNPDTKENGFYSLQVNKPGEPKLLTMGQYFYSVSIYDGLIKAKNANVWVVNRQTASESPNYFTTSDFKTLTPLSDVHPEKNYNWLTSELMSWKDTDGTIMQGILYKPENFDPAKKYPVVFNYYDKLSEKLNEYLRPDLSMDNINIPWYVSQGYLVYTPDINYKTGHPGQSAYNSVAGAAKMLSAYPWVDAAHMGIQGHSFGGYETDNIIARTGMFAAAISASGVSDLISAYNYIWDTGDTNQQHEESGQGRIGATLWERQDLFIENSPVLKADKVTTPLLLMSNIADGGVPYTQGVEMFLSLRRLGKRAWMLQYDNEAHSIIGAAARKDYSIRMNQFFNHYLKDDAAPIWMLKGVPATKKGIDSGLELSTEKDANGKPVTPGPGLVKDNSNQ